MKKTHAAKAGDKLEPLCGQRRVEKSRVLLGGAFKGTVTCAKCKAMHEAIMARRPAHLSPAAVKAWRRGRPLV